MAKGYNILQKRGLHHLAAANPSAAGDTDQYLMSDVTITKRMKDQALRNLGRQMPRLATYLHQAWREDWQRQVKESQEPSEQEMNQSEEASLYGSCQSDDVLLELEDPSIMAELF